MSSQNDYQQLTGICVPYGTGNGKPVWKVMDEEDKDDPIRNIFYKEFPVDVDKTRDFYWTTLKKDCDCKKCVHLLHESDLISVRDGIYSIKIIGQTTSKSNTVELKCPFDAHNMFINMVKQFDNCSECYNSGTFGVSVIYTYKGKEYHITTCNFYNEFYDKYPVEIKNKDLNMFRHVNMTFFNDNVNVMDLGSHQMLVFDEHNRMILRK